MQPKLKPRQSMGLSCGLQPVRPGQNPTRLPGGATSKGWLPNQFPQSFQNLAKSWQPQSFIIRRGLRSNLYHPPSPGRNHCQSTCLCLWTWVPRPYHPEKISPGSIHTSDSTFLKCYFHLQLPLCLHSSKQSFRKVLLGHQPLFFRKF